MNPKVSIIIPVYNGSDYLRDAIDSALQQTYKNIEIIVVNDGSNDGGSTKNIALSFGDRIRYFEKENGGVSSALNVGIKKMKGDFFSWLSHDDLYEENKVELEVAALESEYDIVYCGWSALKMPSGDIIPYNELDGVSRKIIETGVLLPLYGWVSGCSLLIPKKLLCEWGGFDEKYRAVQDYKLWFEIFRGKRVKYVPDKLMFSRIHDKQVTRTYGKRWGEEEWLYKWMAQELNESDLNGIDLSLYQVMSSYLMRLYKTGYREGIKVICNRIKNLEEPSYINSRVEMLQNKFYLCNQFGLYLYCAGKRGRMLLKSLQMRKITVTAISDSDGKKWGLFYGVKCINPIDIPLNSTIIVTKDNPDDLVNELRYKGYKNVLPWEVLLNDLLVTPMYKTELVKWLDRLISEGESI